MSRGCTTWMLLSVSGMACSGWTEPTETSSAAILGGHPVATGELPEVGAIVDMSSALVCTGTLIRPRIVLTAAHCIVLSANQPLAFVRAIELDGGVAETTPIVATYVNPKFVLDPADPSTPLHDIGLVVLAESTSGVAVDPAASTNAPLSGQSVQLAGYGATAIATGSVGVENTATAVVSSVVESEFRLGPSPTPLPCFGDSGGPAFDRSTAPRTVVGVASRASVDGDITCSQGAIYTSVYAHFDWIQSTVQTVEGGPSSKGGCAVCSPPRPSPTAPVAMFFGWTLMLTRRRRNGRFRSRHPRRGG